jgi:hypothetical protein
MEHTGVRWTVEDAQAMLPMRALYPKDQWEAFLEFRVEQEQARLYRKDAAQRRSSHDLFDYSGNR